MVEFPEVESRTLGRMEISLSHLWIKEVRRERRERTDEQGLEDSASVGLRAVALMTPSFI